MWDNFNLKEELYRYNEIFSSCKEGQLCFDGTPNYVMSDKVRRRIKHFTPDAKFIFVLRNPTDRAISHYWHAVRHRRASYSFIKHLRYESLAPIKESFYMHYLPKWYEDFTSEKILVLTLDEIVVDPQSVLEKIASFLGLPIWIPVFGVENQGVSFFSTNAQLLLNFIPKIWNANYNTVEDWNKLNKDKETNFIKKYATKFIRGIGSFNIRMGSKKTQSISNSLRNRLNLLFEKENQGLSKLTGIDFEEIWKLKI